MRVLQNIEQLVGKTITGISNDIDMKSFALFTNDDSYILFNACCQNINCGKSFEDLKDGDI